jgi:hypothetical protein
LDGWVELQIRSQIRDLGDSKLILVESLSFPCTVHGYGDRFETERCLDWFGVTSLFDAIAERLLLTSLEVLRHLSSQLSVC